MTTLANYHDIYHEFSLILNAVNRYTKRGRDVPPDLLRQFGTAYEAYQSALEQMNAAIGGRQ